MILVVAFLLGAVGGALLKLLGHNFIPWPESIVWISAVWAAVVLFLYAGFARALGGVRIETEIIGDNCYYLGFLFTLTSLAVTLYQLSGLENANVLRDIISGFGVALSSTIVGVALRVWFFQSRSGLIELNRDTMHDLQKATRKFRLNVTASLQDMKRFSIESTQLASERNQSIERSTEAALKSNHAQFAKNAEEYQKIISETFRHAFEASAGEMSSTVTKVTEDAMAEIKVPIVDLCNRFDRFHEQEMMSFENLVRAATSIDEKFESIVTTLGVVSLKIAKFSDVLGNTTSMIDSELTDATAGFRASVTASLQDMNRFSIESTQIASERNQSIERSTEAVLKSHHAQFAKNAEEYHKIISETFRDKFEATAGEMSSSVTRVTEDALAEIKVPIAELGNQFDRFREQEMNSFENLVRQATSIEAKYESIATTLGEVLLKVAKFSDNLGNTTSTIDSQLTVATTEFRANVMASLQDMKRFSSESTHLAAERNQSIERSTEEAIKSHHAQLAKNAEEYHKIVSETFRDTFEATAGEMSSSVTRVTEDALAEIKVPIVELGNRFDRFREQEMKSFENLVHQVTSTEAKFESIANTLSEVSLKVARFSNDLGNTTSTMDSELTDATARIRDASVEIAYVFSNIRAIAKLDFAGSDLRRVADSLLETHDRIKRIESISESIDSGLSGRVDSLRDLTDLMIQQINSLLASDAFDRAMSDDREFARSVSNIAKQFDQLAQQVDGLVRIILLELSHARNDERYESGLIRDNTKILVEGTKQLKYSAGETRDEPLQESNALRRLVRTVRKRF